MCTIGAKILQRGKEYVVFKNRDFTRTRFDDALYGDDDVFGIMGLESWQDDVPDAVLNEFVDDNPFAPVDLDTWQTPPLSNEKLSGFAFGFNNTLTCTDAFVQHSPDAENFDKLVQAIVIDCSTVQEAVPCVQDKVKTRRYGSCNLVVANAYETAAIEVRAGQVGFEASPIAIVRTNHHVSIGAVSDTAGSITSHDRYQAIQAGIEKVASVADLLALLSSHFPAKTHGICNHGELNTVYSYVLHWKEGATTLYVHQGNPCDGKPYAQVEVDFDGDTNLGAYLSHRDIFFF